MDDKLFCADCTLCEARVGLVKIVGIAVPEGKLSNYVGGVTDGANGKQ